MSKQLIIIFAFSLALFSCSDSNDKKEKNKDTLGNLSDKDLLPQYETVYLPDSVEIENIESLLTSDSIDEKTCLAILSNSCKALKADFKNYLLNSYQTLEYSEDRLPYIDIGNISRFIIQKFKFNDTSCFDTIFQYAELILDKRNKPAQNLIIVGLFEGIQNVGGWHQVDYYKGFDKWLKPKSKKAWDELIDFWEKKKDSLFSVAIVDNKNKRVFIAIDSHLLADIPKIRTIIKEIDTKYPFGNDLNISFVTDKKYAGYKTDLEETRGISFYEFYLNYLGEYNKKNRIFWTYPALANRKVKYILDSQDGD